jgi:Beta-propeller repeat
MSQQFARSSHALLLTLALLASALPAGADPTLIYSTYLGGSNRDDGWAVAMRNGDTYIAGTTYSLDFPVKFPPRGLTSSKPSGDTFTRDIFVARLGSSGTPIYSRYVPAGDNHNAVLGIGAGPNGSAYMASVSLHGSDAPITVVKLDGGGGIEWVRGTGAGRTYANDMTVDPQGNVYITGYDNNEYSNGYVQIAFVWKIGSDGSTRYWTAIDGNNFDNGFGIAADAAGNAYVTGITLSTDLPNALQAPPVGGYNVFVTKLGPEGSIHWSTYLGGSGEDWGKEIAVAADGTLVVAGTTTSPNFNIDNAIQTELSGPKDLFLARLQPWGSRISSTYLGGSGSEEVADLALEPSSILLAVTSTETDSPLREPLDPSCGASFVAKLNPSASRVLDAACLGHSSVAGVAADSSGVSVTGAAGDDLPVVNAWQPSPAGGGDAFAAKLKLNHAPDCSAATANPASLWPADGSFVWVSIGGVTDLEGDSVTIALTSIFQDEWRTYSGTPDGTGLGTSAASLRASRLNYGNGRVYHLGFTATDARGDACNGLVKVCVPMQQGGTCVDGGPRVDSTQSY